VLSPLVAGTALVMAGTYTSLAPALRYVGLFAILAAAVWSAWPRVAIPDALRLRARSS
jgi:hypothetical protein